MEGLKQIFSFASSTIEKSPQIIGISTMFYLVATTFMEMSATGVPFWSTLGDNAISGATAVLEAGSDLFNTLT